MTPRSKLILKVIFIISLVANILAGGYFLSKKKSFIPFDDIRKSIWGSDFNIVEVKSTLDKKIQKVYSFKTTSAEKQPLIVSLHTWSGDYKQADPLAKEALRKNWNYIHPDFRGPINTRNACCGDLALQDLDDAIDYAIEHFNVDKERIYVVGVSGGGYAALSSFMKSKHSIASYSSWCPISDIEAWYNESIVRRNNYAEDILKLTGSFGSVLDLASAYALSPLYWPTPISKLDQTKLKIYTGIFDGIQGSVPITHSINFYNKVLHDLKVSDSTFYVSAEETLFLLEKRSPIGRELGKIGGRDIFLFKKFGNISLTIFEGGHEMLPDVALDIL